MGKMKLYELVNKYHIGTELTCAEAMFMACNEYYPLNLSEETRNMFSVMGIGMQTEHSCCGAFTVAAGIIGLMTAKEGQTDVDNLEGYQMICELTDLCWVSTERSTVWSFSSWRLPDLKIPATPLWRRLQKNWKNCWRDAVRCHQ